MTSLIETSTAAALSKGADREISLLRLYLLRAVYLSWAIGGLVEALPRIWQPEATDRGLMTSMFGGLWVMGLIGLRYPLKVLPIFLFEFFAKTIWVCAFGAPRLFLGEPSPLLMNDLLTIGNGPVLFGLVIPWGYVYRHYVKARGDRWR